MLVMLFSFSEKVALQILNSVGKVQCMGIMLQDVIPKLKLFVDIYAGQCKYVILWFVFSNREGICVFASSIKTFIFLCSISLCMCLKCIINCSQKHLYNWVLYMPNLYRAIFIPIPFTQGPLASVCFYVCLYAWSTWCLTVPNPMEVKHSCKTTGLCCISACTSFLLTAFIPLLSHTHIDQHTHL